MWNCFIFFLSEYSSVWPEIFRVLPQIQSRFLRRISGKNYSRRIFQKFYWKPRLLYRNSWNFALLSEILFWVRIALKRLAQVVSYVVFPQVRRHVHKQITKKRYGEEKPRRYFFGEPVLFTLGLGLTTPYSLGISVTNFYQTFVTVSIEFWRRFETQNRPTGSAINFLFITARAKRKGRLCVKLFYFFPRGILIHLTWNLSRFAPNTVEIFTWNIGKKLFWENFSEILLKTKAILYRNSWNFALLFEILFWVRIAFKRFAQVVSYVVCPQVRSHVHKQITKTRYGEEKPGPFVFEKPVLFTLGLGLSTPYPLGISVSHFYQTFITVSIEFWLRFEAQILPTGFAIHFSFIIARAERKVRLFDKLFYFFSRWILIRLTWNLSRFAQNSVGILTWNFGKKLFRANFYWKPRLSSTETREISQYFLKFYFGSVLRWKDSHK